tara:strand:+ start:9440 stop:10186 length:747 start_codon:yes stop_codon:yes gene_type:complete
MADKFPLIANTSAQQIQEISSGDNLNLLGNSIVGVVSITASGNVSVGGTLTYEDVTNIDSVGIITAKAGIRVTGDVIEALAGENKIPALYADLASLPSASTYHGMFAHVHSEGKGYFSHAGNWLELVNRDTSGNVTVSGTISDDKGNVRNIVRNYQSGAYTLVASDAGKSIVITTGGVTIPASVFVHGDAITIINDSGSDQTITCSAITTYLAGDTSTKSSLTLKARGVCTFIFASNQKAYGSGAGLE